MLEAMWTVTFGRVVPGQKTVQVQGAGVLVLETGRVFGGDTAFSYIGGYSVKDDVLTAKVHVSKHSSMLQNIFGIDEFDLTLTGRVGGEKMMLNGAIDGVPQAQLLVEATRKADLP